MSSRVDVISEIAPTARIASDVRVGPFCVIGPHVTIGPGTILSRRITVVGHTSIGSQNHIEEGCVLGASPQDLKYAGQPTVLIIGHRNRLGRGVTAHIGTELGGFITRIGSDNVILDGCHVAHDCYIDDKTHLGRYVMLAGHIRVQTGAVMEDFAGAHHFVTVGRYARVGPRTPVRRDVPPFTWFYSEDYGWTAPSVRGIHEQGIRAAKLRRYEERELRQALADLFDDEAALQTKIEQIITMGAEGEVAALCEFCQNSLKGVFGRQRELHRGKTPPEAAETPITQQWLDPRRRST